MSGSTKLYKVHLFFGFHKKFITSSNWNENVISFTLIFCGFFKSNFADFLSMSKSNFTVIYRNNIFTRKFTHCFCWKSTSFLELRYPYKNIRKTWVKNDYCIVLYCIVQGDPLNNKHGSVFFLVPCKKWHVKCTNHFYRVPEKTQPC